ncbi:MAG: hypothetical protein PHQ04_10580 [Opitutaceae bacterium]|nr:hypothetical protein [Opitutaceae bacterium]
MGTLAGFFSWLIQKTAVVTTILVLGMSALVLWVFLRDRVDFDLRRSEVIRALTGETRKLEAALSDVDSRMRDLRSEIASQQQRALQAAKVVAELSDLNGGFNRLLGDPMQLRTNEERMVRLKEMEAEATARVGELRQALVRAGWEKDGLEIALGRLQRDLQMAEESKSKIMHYFHEAWTRYGLYVSIALALYVMGPSLVRWVAYYLLAPFVMRSRPVLLGATGSPPPQLAVSRTSVDATLGPGDALWVKGRFLQATDEGLRRKTCIVLDWRLPLTCAACGLVELIEMRNDSPHAVRRAVFSSQEDPHTELALVTLPADGSLVLRPSFLAGVIALAGRQLRIRRHWRIFTWQSWITGQFRYFEFCGPCRLLIAGSRGVRAEILDVPPGAEAPARRTNQDSTIGFTPGLAYRPVRAETFWSYFRGRNPLFDDLFEGCGVFLCQQTSAKSETAEARKFWTQVWSGLMRLGGI